jgi:hypothetical protein
MASTSAKARVEDAGQCLSVVMSLAVEKKKTPKRDIAVIEYGLRNCEVGKLIYYM